MSSNSDFEIHGFAEASKEDMRAVIHCRVLGLDSSITNLMLAKTKVAPLKTQTTPIVLRMLPRAFRDHFFYFRVVGIFH